MLDDLMFTINQYMAFYSKFLMDQWQHMSPIKYGIILICIGGFGWLLMRNSVKKC